MPPPLCDTLSRVPFRRLNPSMCNPYLGLGLCIIDMPSRNVFKLVDSLLFPTTLVLIKNSSDPLLLPLMMQSSHESETHYYPLINVVFYSMRILRRLSRTQVQPEDSISPYIPWELRAVALTLGDLRIDWKTTFGRWAFRYFTVIATWWASSQSSSSIAGES